VIVIVARFAWIRFELWPWRRKDAPPPTMSMRFAWRRWSASAAGTLA